MNIIFCADPLNRNAVDQDWILEFEQTKRLGIATHLLNYEDLTLNKNIDKVLKSITKLSKPEMAVYRGWMMPVELYERFYNVMKNFNLTLVNNPKEYKYTYYLPESYEIIKDFTPQTVFIKACPPFSDTALEILLSNFGNKSVIVKDYVKSQKHYWNEACFIPDASNTQNAVKIINKFIELQGENFQEGIVLREFVELEPVGIHSKSKMPLTKEYRLFVLNGRIVAVNNYWDEEYYSDENLPFERFESLYKKIDSHFYTMDIAKLKNGDWIIIELGDAQVAEFMATSGLDKFYNEIGSQARVENEKKKNK